MGYKDLYTRDTGEVLVQELDWLLAILSNLGPEADRLVKNLADKPQRQLAAVLLFCSSGWRVSRSADLSLRNSPSR